VPHVLPVPVAVCSGSTGFVPVSQCSAGSVPSLGSAGWQHVGAVAGDPSDAQGHGLCCLPPLTPSLRCIPVLSGGVRFSGSGSDPPHRAPTAPSSPHLGAGCAQIPITAWVPIPPGPSRLAQGTSAPRNPRYWVGGHPALAPPGEKPWEAAGAGRCRERC